MAIAGPRPAGEDGSPRRAGRGWAPHAASLVQAKPGSPIGVSGGAAFEPTLLTTAARGTLIAYTDGLVERWGETLDTGLKRLLQTAADRCGSSLDDLLTSLVSELTGDSPTDDIALIGLRWLN